MSSRGYTSYRKRTASCAISVLSVPWETPPSAELHQQFSRDPPSERAGLQLSTYDKRLLCVQCGVVTRLHPLKADQWKLQTAGRLPAAGIAQTSTFS